MAARGDLYLAGMFVIWRRRKLILRNGDYSAEVLKYFGDHEDVTEVLRHPRKYSRVVAQSSTSIGCIERWNAAGGITV